MGGGVDVSDEQVAVWHSAVSDARAPLDEMISFHDYISSTLNPDPPGDANSNERNPPTVFDPNTAWQHPSTAAVNLQQMSEQESDGDYSSLLNVVERHRHSKYYCMRGDKCRFKYYRDLCQHTVIEFTERPDRKVRAHIHAATNDARQVNLNADRDDVDPADDSGQPVRAVRMSIEDAYSSRMSPARWEVRSESRPNLVDLNSMSLEKFAQRFQVSSRSKICLHNNNNRRVVLQDHLILLALITIHTTCMLSSNGNHGLVTELMHGVVFSSLQMLTYVQNGQLTQGHCWHLVRTFQTHSIEM